MGQPGKLRALGARDPGSNLFSKLDNEIPGIPIPKLKMPKKITARGFGARYGKSVRQKYAKIESKQRKKQKCPFCKKTAKRLSKGERNRGKPYLPCRAFC